MRRFSEKTVVVLWIVVIVTLAAATFVEKYLGSQAAQQYVYGSWWFAGLWAALAGFSLVEIRQKKLYRNVPLFLLHLSFIVILAGALCTKLWGERGQIVLQKNEPNIVEKITLPFTVSLDTFYVQYYAGTNTPSDYVSGLTVCDTLSGETQRGQVSMNRIFSYKNYRFYQSSFTPDETASVLSINHDPVGIATTYTGYALFFLSGLWLILRKVPLNRKLRKASTVVILLLLLSPSTMRANVQTSDGLTISEAQAKKFGDLWILYDGRITSVSVFAHDFTMKLTGKKNFSYMNAEQFLAGFLFFPEKWQNVALFEIKDPALKKILNAETQRASFDDFFDGENNYKLTAQPRTKETGKLNDKIQLINLLHGGSLLQLFPLPQSGQLHWYYPTENFPLDEGQDNITFVRTILSDYYTALHNNDEAKADSILNSISDFQKKNAQAFLPTEAHKRIEIFYMQHNPVPMLFKINLTAGILLLLLLFVLKNEKRRKLVSKLFFVQLIHSFCFLTVSIALRTSIAGRLPFASGSETMLLLAWIAMLAAWIFHRKTPLAVPFGLIISGCALLVAHLGMANPKITPLMPVLSSPLLSIHVSVIMIAYLLLAFTALNGLISLLVFAFSKNKAALQNAQQNSLLCLRPALFFLGTGIFIGAVWANISWGTYWSWDPKEVWALITFLTYALALHKRDFAPVAFHAFVLAAFSTVLITYFGVNYFFGGMHGYS